MLSIVCIPSLLSLYFFYLARTNNYTGQDCSRHVLVLDTFGSYFQTSIIFPSQVWINGEIRIKLTVNTSCKAYNFWTPRVAHAHAFCLLIFIYIILDRPKVTLGTVGTLITPGYREQQFKMEEKTIDMSEKPGRSGR